ncbi:hypothetical protein CH48_1189 [Yersinia enterocolitica]|nr:hypothetical protein CH48_1189 [Yersinia enterocolitica]
MARLEPPGMGLRRLYDLPVFTDTDTLSLTSTPPLCGVFFCLSSVAAYHFLHGA